MKKYEKYKKIDLPWLSEIPEHWNIIKNKFCFKLYKEIVGVDSFKTELLSLTKKGVKIKSKEISSGKQPSTFDTYQYVYPNQLVMCLYDLDCSAVFSGLSNYYGMISPSYNVYKITNLIYPKFADYWFSYCFINREYKIFSTSLRFTMNDDVFKSINTPIPPFEEQKQIANYLDWKINEIDKLIEKEQNKLILLNKYLKIKVCKIITNSESLNSSWSIDMECSNSVKLSKIVSLKNVKASKNLRYIGLENIEQWTGNYKTNTDIYSYADAKLINAEDIGIGLLRPYLAKVFLSNGTYAVSSEICVLNNIKINKKFLKEVLLNIKFIDELNSSTYGTRMPRANWDFLKNMKIPIYHPDIENFKVHKILELKNKINTIEINTKLIIENLNELKNSIISEVVTGKIDVRDVVIPKYEKLNINEVIKEDSFEKGIESDDE